MSNTFGERAKLPWWTVKVWFDYKRDCYSTDAAFVLAKKLKIKPLEAAHLLAERLNSNPRIQELCK